MGKFHLLCSQVMGCCAGQPMFTKYHEGNPNSPNHALALDLTVPHDSYCLIREIIERYILLLLFMSCFTLLNRRSSIRD